MKVRNKRGIIAIIILVPVVLFASLYFLDTENSNEDSKPIQNNVLKGVTVMYRAMKELNYPVYIGEENILQKDINTIQVIFNLDHDSNNDFKDARIRDWIYEGGKLIYLSSNWEYIRTSFANYGEQYSLYYDEKNREKAIAFTYGQGYALFADPTLLSNNTLITNTDGAYWILKQIDRWGYNNIEFISNFHIQDQIIQERTLWSDIPLSYKVIIFQVLIVIAVIIIRKGKRFGSPVPLYEEVERQENEYLNTIAALYKEAECWEAVFLNYYRDFIELCHEILFINLNSCEENWLKVWEKEKISNYTKAAKLYQFVNHLRADSGERRKPGEFLSMIARIEELKETLVKRRETSWIL